MSKFFYRFDKNKVSYVKVQFSFGDKIRSLLAFSSISLLGGGIITLIFFNSFHDLKVDSLTKQQDSLIKKYSVLQEDISGRQNQLAELQLKDDSLYRTILELDPLDPSVREAGFGGSAPYVEFEEYENSELLIGSLQQVDIINSQLKIQVNSYESLEEFAIEKDRKIDCMPGIQPISVDDFYRISDYYGYRRDPFTRARRYHYGMDMTGPRGCPVYATANGVVTRTEYARGYGKMIEIDHGYGYSTRYAHLDDIAVNIGDKVGRGTFIGKLGNTGRSTGPHLHYEVRVDDKTVNPINYYCNQITSKEYNRMIELESETQ